MGNGGEREKGGRRRGTWSPEGLGSGSGSELVRVLVVEEEDNGGPPEQAARCWTASTRLMQAGPRGEGALGREDVEGTRLGDGEGGGARLGDDEGGGARLGDGEGGEGAARGTANTGAAGEIDEAGERLERFGILVWGEA